MQGVPRLCRQVPGAQPSARRYAHSGNIEQAHVMARTASSGYTKPNQTRNDAPLQTAGRTNRRYRWIMFTDTAARTMQRKRKQREGRRHRIESPNSTAL